MCISLEHSAQLGRIISTLAVNILLCIGEDRIYECVNTRTNIQRRKVNNEKYVY